MFDRLVESSRHKQGRRASSYMLVTSLFYTLALFVFVALAVLGFNPILAHEGSFLAKVTLPPVPADSLPMTIKCPTANTPAPHLQGAL